MALPALKRNRLRQWFDGDPVYKAITPRRQKKIDAMLQREREAAEMLIAIENGEEVPTTTPDGKKLKVKPSKFVTQPQITGLKITPSGIKLPKVKPPKLKPPKMPKIPKAPKMPKIKIP